MAWISRWMRAYPSLAVLLLILFGMSIISLAFYLGAVKLGEKGTSKFARLER